MAHLTVSVEYGIHCLLWLVGSGETPLSSRDLAELQGISVSFVAKIFPRLEKAGIVAACEGVRGGYRLARPPEEISFLQIVDAIEGSKPLFDCQEIRGRCAVFEASPPEWATRGVCGVHQVMLKAEKAMREELAAHSLAEVAATFSRKAPGEFFVEVRDWTSERAGKRKPGRRPGKPEPPS
ncbi:Rrf2 family transcriptional regulator [Zoogloea sp.]|uniref:RrF2 family transcriptional regulator n=1 Tax=Zoogloea sp. TaxID=49181 RepID=UPI001415EDFE|nr:MAG: Rrf2 family transcriptional regulator [Zoogloea sp.]